MHKFSKGELSSQYPTAKTPNEIWAERRRRQLERRPRHVILKLATWTMCIVFTVKIAYTVIAHTITGSLDSSGAVIFGVSVSFGLVMLVGAIILYLYSLINNLATRIFTNPTDLYVWLICIVVLASAAALMGNIWITTGVLVTTFLVACAASKWFKRHEIDP